MKLRMPTLPERRQAAKDKVMDIGLNLDSGALTDGSVSLACVHQPNPVVDDARALMLPARLLSCVLSFVGGPD